MKRLLPALALTWGLACAPAAHADYPVGERHLEAREPAAALRDAQHRETVRVTVWYPATATAQEQDLAIGPPDNPLFYVGEAAPNADFADERRRPVILLSHGFGGTARMMGWFGTVMAAQGYIVVAVDHPGSNGADPITVAGAALFWERPGDLAAALARVRADVELNRRMDLNHVGVAGFSAGGFAALAAAGGQVDLDRFRTFCRDRPDDGVCRPQKEAPDLTVEAGQAFLESDAARPALERAHGDLSIPEVRAAFVMAPAIVQALDPRSLQALRTPVGIILGDSDEVAAPNTNGGAAARLIPGARLKVLPGVGHYDFLSRCTPAGDALVRDLCPVRTPRSETHHAALEQALILFGRAFGPPP